MVPDVFARSVPENNSPTSHPTSSRVQRRRTFPTSCTDIYLATRDTQLRFQHSRYSIYIPTTSTTEMTSSCWPSLLVALIMLLQTVHAQMNDLFLIKSVGQQGYALTYQQRSSIPSLAVSTPLGILSRPSSLQWIVSLASASEAFTIQNALTHEYLGVGEFPELITSPQPALWKIAPVGRNRYTVQLPGANMYLNLPTSAPFTPIVLSQYEGDPNQQWELEPVDVE